MVKVTALSRMKTSGALSQVAAVPVARIYLLGTMRAVAPTGASILPRNRRTQALLAYLCLSPGERVPRSRIAGVIWDRSGETQARDSLRHALRELEHTGAWHIEKDYEAIRFDPVSCWIDVQDCPDRSDLLLEDLYGTTSAIFDQWVLGERIRFENRWQAVLEKELYELVDSKGPPELRAEAARRLLNFVPIHETAVRHLMVAFTDMEDRAQALREYDRFRQIAHVNLGIAPSKGTRELYDAICREARAMRLSGQTEKVENVTHLADVVPHITAPAIIAPTSRGLQPSIAVLPFRTLSVDTGYEAAAEGLVDDLVEGLSRVPGLFVVSRLSAAAVGAREAPPTEIGDVLGVRYLLSGSLRVIDDHIRLVVEMADAATGAALWRSRYDEPVANLLDVQDQLAEKVIRSVAPSLHAAELRRVRVTRPEDQTAYDLLLRAQERMHHPSREVFDAAEELFDLAILREPHYAAALAWRAYWHVMRVGQGWSHDPAEDAVQADRFIELAIACDPADPMALAVQGHVATYLHKDFDRAFSCFDAALQINSNSGRALLWSGNAHGYLGEGTLAVEKVNRAMALSPYDPLSCAYSGGACLAYLADGQYTRAVEFALRCIRENRGYSAAYKMLITALALDGRETEARAPLHQLLLLEPGFNVQEHRHRFPGSGTSFGEITCDALARAGVPLSF